MSKLKFGVFSALDSEDIIKGKNHIKNITKYFDTLDDKYESVWLPDRARLIIG